jgi:thiol-disulfide isomerase/thioredoxin
MNKETKSFTMNNIRRCIAVISSTLILCLLFTGCMANEQNSGESGLSGAVGSDKVQSVSPELVWLTTSLTNVATGERFTIKELADQGKPVIINSFAVWCPGCSMQLLESTKLLAANPDKYNFVAIDIDPNENSDKVKRHQLKNSYGGIFATSPSAVTRSLVSAYGPRFALEIPQTIIISNTTARYLGDGVFSEATLQEAINDLNNK